MRKIRRSEERGTARWSWLHSRHTFSFGEYYDPKHMGFGPLRVINEDRVAPGAGFPRHPHRDMEIISYVIQGALEHQDSMGTGSVIRAGDIQYMSAGTGVLHSEFNASKDEPVEFLQIWLIPSSVGTAPAYAQQTIDESARHNTWTPLASPDGREGSIAIKQDAVLLTSKVDREHILNYEPAPHHGLWLQVVRGTVSTAGERLAQGDGLAVVDEPLSVTAGESAELLLFDLAGDA